MERLTEQIVDWHNRHPLAKRISPIDVHTVGVVALPFMRQSRRATLPQEPVLNEVVNPIHEAETRDALEPAEHPPAPAEAAAAAAAEHEADDPGSNEPGVFSDFETQKIAQATKGPRWWQALQARLFRLRRQRWGNHWQWPVFSETLIPKISAARVARFALAHGYNEVPGDPEWPKRVVAVDEAYVTRGSAKQRGGAWPFELFLVSAGIDAGTSRSRVLVGQGSGRRLEIAGRRCMSPLRMAAAAVLLLAVLGLAWLRFGRDDEVARQNAAALAAALAASAPASAASAASAVALPASAPASMAEAASDAASAASAAASSVAVAVPASAPASSASSGMPAAAAAASAPAQLSSGPRLVEPPDIRPQLVTRASSAPRMHGMMSPVPLDTAPSPASPTATEAASSGARGARPDPSRAMAEAPGPAVKLSAVPAEGKQVALVGPSSVKREDAEALLAKMQETLRPMVSDADTLQGQIFKTPTGFAPAIWPFATREQAQLINALMVARGLHTKAVDF